MPRAERDGVHRRRATAWGLAIGLWLLGGSVGTAQDLIGSGVRPIAETTVQLVVDSPQPLSQRSDAAGGPFYQLVGWAADVRATRGTGVRQIVAYLNGPAGRGQLLGWARTGLPRADVGTALNNPATNASGFDLRWRVADLPIQAEIVREYPLYLYAQTDESWVEVRLPIRLATWANGSTGPD